MLVHVLRGVRHAICSPSTTSWPAGTGLSPELRASIDTVIKAHKVVVFMKGTPQFPQCGFSNTVCQILRSMNVPFEGVNILANEALRSGMKEYSMWPT
jgi:monothiol glutaredoxin